LSGLVPRFGLVGGGSGSGGFGGFESFGVFLAIALVLKGNVFAESLHGMKKEIERRSTPNPEISLRARKTISLSGAYLLTTFEIKEEAVLRKSNRLAKATT